MISEDEFANKILAEEYEELLNYKQTTLIGCFAIDYKKKQITASYFSQDLCKKINTCKIPLKEIHIEGSQHINIKQYNDISLIHLKYHKRYKEFMEERSKPKSLDYYKGRLNDLLIEIVKPNITEHEKRFFSEKIASTYEDSREFATHLYKELRDSKIKLEDARKEIEAAKNEVIALAKVDPDQCWVEKVKSLEIQNNKFKHSFLGAVSLFIMSLMVNIILL